MAYRPRQDKAYGYGADNIAKHLHKLLANAKVSLEMAYRLTGPSRLSKPCPTTTCTPFTLMHSCTPSHSHTHAHLHTHTLMHTFTFMHTFTPSHSHTHAHLHIHAHLHTHSSNDSVRRQKCGQYKETANTLYSDHNNNCIHISV